jgi:hypothetical protein
VTFSGSPSASLSLASNPGAATFSTWFGRMLKVSLRATGVLFTAMAFSVDYCPQGI